MAHRQDYPVNLPFSTPACVPFHDSINTPCCLDHYGRCFPYRDIKQKQAGLL